MLEHLLELKLIELPPMKRPQQAVRTNDPNYRQYHHPMSHHVERCFILEGKIMDLAGQGKIAFNDDVTTSNVVSVPWDIEELPTPTIQFGNLEPTLVEAAYSYPLHITGSTRPLIVSTVEVADTRPFTHVAVDLVEVEEEGWILVTIQRRASKPTLRVSRNTRGHASQKLPIT